MHGNKLPQVASLEVWYSSLLVVSRVNFIHYFHKRITVVGSIIVIVSAKQIWTHNKADTSDIHMKYLNLCDTQVTSENVG